MKRSWKVKNKKHNRIYKSLEQSLKEVKLYKEGKLHLDTWQEFLERKGGK